NKQNFINTDFQNLKFKNYWAFWEGYKQEKGNTQVISDKFLDNNYKIVEFNDLRQLQIIWCTKLNKISNFFNFEGKFIRVELQKYSRIIESISLFKQNIVPAWEDPLNVEGGDLQIFFDDIQSKDQIDSIYKVVVQTVLSDDYPFINETNGVRFNDKTRDKQATKIRMEIWFNFNESNDGYAQKLENIQKFFEGLVGKHYKKISFTWVSHSHKK
ncbi:translation initiation factor, putative, partial [Ichthyophthirius multifiliis]